MVFITIQENIYCSSTHHKYYYSKKVQVSSIWCNLEQQTEHPKLAKISTTAVHGLTNSSELNAVPS
jgi:hypothetical protein